ncbi:SpoIIE family protein phosphatase [Nocardioides rubriscoriae]|uniref:SpoIIE family protein phosphatase n=1 Tax=Nocardioides rubriscoriae TaxID=642762 RepID=UPI001B861D5F|nr:SpoIIE family protein phosphatase [Nocardioides rubriscoriae]
MTLDRSGATTGPFADDGRLEQDRARLARRLALHPGLPSVSRLVDLAVRLTGSASAQVSLISDVQTVVAATGAAQAAVGAESPAAESLCTVTVRERGAVVIDDATRDQRVAGLPPVTSGAVGSYLGVPLVAGGVVVGALCLFDQAPRTWSEQEVALVRALATPVVAELELAALESEREEERLVWQLAVDAGGVGAFDWNLLTGELRWDERLLQLFGLARQEFGGTIEAFNEVVHPDDRDRVAQALDRAVATCGDFEVEYRIGLPDGQVRWIGARGRALAGEDGVAVKVLGAASDTTAAQDQEAKVARVLDSMPTGFFHLDTQWRFTYANAEAVRLLGGIGVDVVGEVLWELFPAAVGTEFETGYRSAVESGKPVLFEAYYPPPLDSWFEVRGWPGPDGLSVYFLEVNAQHEARVVLERAAQRSALLGSVTQALSDSLEPRDAVSRLAGLVVPGLADWCIVTLAEGEQGAVRDWRQGLRDAGWWHDDPDLRPLLDDYAAARLPALSDTSFVARALRQMRPVVVAGGAAEALTDALTPGRARDLAERLDPWSAVVVPLTGHDRLVGLLSVFRDRDRESFTPVEVATLEEVAGRAGLALDNMRLHREQRDLASALQQSMLTAPPEPDHLHVAVRYQPAAEVAQVGGDWYDAFVQRGGATMVVIGDVVGHDTAAAAAMGQLRSVLRGVAVTSDESPAQVLRRVDEAISLLMIDTIATAAVGRFEQTPEELELGLTRLRWSNAGHPPPLVVDADGRVDVLWGAKPDMLLGVLPGTVREDVVVTLRRGATVLLYTDGLVERRGRGIDEGIEQLTQVLGELVADGRDLEELCDELLRRLAPERSEDDIALVAVRLYRQDEPRPPEAGPRRVPRCSSSTRS